MIKRIRQRSSGGRLVSLYGFSSVVYFLVGLITHKDPLNAVCSRKACSMRFNVEYKNRTDCVVLYYQVTEKLKRATTLDTTTVLAIIFIH